MAVGKLKNYYFKRRQGHYDFKIHMMTTTSVKKNTTLAIFLYTNSKFRYFFFRSCKVSFYFFGKLKNYYFKRRQGHYDFKIHMMTTTSVKKNTTLAIFLYTNSKFRYFFFRSCKVSFYCTDFGSLASDSFPQSSRSLRSALEAEVRRLSFSLFLAEVFVQDAP